MGDNILRYYEKIEKSRRSYIHLLDNPRKKVIKILSAFIIYIIIFYTLMTISTVIFKYILNISYEYLSIKSILSLNEFLELGYFEKLIDWFLFLLIPTAIFTYRLIYKEPHGTLISTDYRFRWKWIKKCLTILFPIMVFVIIGQTLLDGIPDFIFSSGTIGAVLLSIIITPFQAAGEEYLFRAFALQVFATIIKSDKWAWIILSIISSFIFSILHLPEDLCTGIDLFIFGILMCVLVYFTEGIEASIIFHSLNNILLNIVMDLTGDNGNLFKDTGRIADGPFIESTVVSIITDILICGLVIWLWKNYKRNLTVNHLRSIEKIKDVDEI